MIEIKKLKEEDVNLAFSLVKDWRNESTNKDREHIAELNKLELVERLSDENFHVFVAIQKGKVIGGLTGYTLPLVTRAESKMFLYDIEVQEKFRKRGVASKLVEELKKFCVEKEIMTIFLCTELENEVAQKLYKKMGGEKEIVLMYHFKLE